ncbi:hypothetical protein NA78x_005461 [Anatilimnocola sp. NA78]|uniref:hypothetical protein n=1 Tax=Anatilimnocola sp. NA78 TaxID=3415683 RepID=UPI003CE5A0F3
MESKPTTRELMDACRVDRHDPERAELASELAPFAREVQADPALNAALQRSQQFDRNVREALDDVPLPAGLAERLLAGCEAALVTPASTIQPANEPVYQQPHWSRRRLVIGATAGSLLVVLLSVFGIRLLPQKPITNEELASLADRWFTQSGPAAKWLPVASAPAQFPVDRAITARPSKWAALDSQTVVYDLTRPGGQRALLFVRSTTQPHSLRNFPFTKLPVTGGWAIGAWNRGDVIYVLVVVEDGQRIEQFVKQSRVI